LAGCSGELNLEGEGRRERGIRVERGEEKTDEEEEEEE